MAWSYKSWRFRKIQDFELKLAITEQQKSFTGGKLSRAALERMS